FLFAHGCWSHGAAGFARGGSSAHSRTVAGAKIVLGRASRNFREIVGEFFEFEFGELAGDGEELVPQFAVEKTDDDMSSADLKFAEHERPKDPGAFDNIGNIGREIGYGCCPAGKLVQSRNQIGSDARRIELKMLDDTMDVGVL